MVLGALVCIGCGPNLVQVGGDDDDDNTSPTPTPSQGISLQLVGTSGRSLAADIAANGSGTVVAMSGWFDGTVILYDVSDRQNPAEVATISGIGYNTDVQFRGDVLYINHEGQGRGIDIYDVSTPSNPVLKGQVGPATGYPASLEDCHNTWPQQDRALLYCASSTTGQMVILSVGESGGTPESPEFVTAINPPIPGYGTHDMYALGDRLYVAWLDSGLAIYDILDPSSPTLLAHKTYNGMFTHNVWPTEDGKYLLTTDEVLGGHVRVWDIQDLSNVQQVAQYSPNTGATVHNVKIIGTVAYVSHYTDGVKAVDISNPKDPKELGSFDFFTGPDSVGGDPYSSMQGNWGVEAVPPFVFASGMETGLYVLELK